MNGDVKIWDIRQSDIPITSTNVFANGLSSMAVHPHCPVFAATSAPYASSTYNESRSSHGAGPAGVRRGQRLNVYRMDDDYPASHSTRGYNDGQGSPLNGSMSDTYSGLPSSSRRRNSSLGSNGGTNTDGPQPTLLSSVMLKGDGGHISTPPTPSISGLPSDHSEHDKKSGRQATTLGRPQTKRRWGAGMNALSFHPVSAYEVDISNRCIRLTLAILTDGIGTGCRRVRSCIWRCQNSHL
jgi:hypothetical protein